MTRAGQEALLDLCRRHGLGLIADEVYHRNVLAGPDPAPSFLHAGRPRRAGVRAQRLLQGLGDDRLAAGLDGPPAAAWSSRWRCWPSATTPVPPCSRSMAAIAALEEGEAFVAEFNARCRRNAELVMATARPASARPAAARRRARSTPSRGSRASPTAWPSRAACWPRPRSASPPATPSAPGNEDHVRLCFAIGTERLEEALRRVIAVLDR